MAEFKRIRQRTTNTERIKSKIAQVEPNELVIATDTDELYFKNQQGEFVSVSKGNTTFDTIETLVNSNNKLKVGDIVDLQGYYTAGDGAHHKRMIALEDDGSGVKLASRLWANIVHNGDVNVSWFGAKGDGNTDDSDNISKVFAFTSGAKIKNINFDAKTYRITKSLELNYSWKVTIDGNGARIISRGSFEDFMIKLKPVGTQTWPPPQYITIKNIELDGNFKSSGIDILVANDWLLSRVNVWNCEIGIRMKDTYYGEISGNCSVRDCMHGIQIVGEETNTIKLDNIHINFSVQLDNFRNRLEGESDIDFLTRCPTKGVDIQGNILNIKFYGLTIEGFAYGFAGTILHGSNGVTIPFFSISECYFENNKIYNIYLYSTNGFLIPEWSVSIKKCRFFKKKIPVRLSSGIYTIVENQNIEIELTEYGALRTRVTTDSDPESIGFINKKYDMGVIEFVNKTPKNTDVKTHGKLGDSQNTYPNDIRFLKTSEESYSKETYLGAKNIPYGRIYDIKSLTTKNITFEEDTSGVIVNDTYTSERNMLMLYDGKIIPYRVTNPQFIAPSQSAKTALWLYNNRNLPEGSTFICKETNVECKLTDGKWMRTGNQVLEIGTSEELANAIPSNPENWWSVRVWSIDANVCYVWQQNYWSLGSINGLQLHNRTNKRAIGTTAQRPVLNTLEKTYWIYYNTDTKKHEMIDNGIWVEWDGKKRIDYESLPNDFLLLDTPYYIQKLISEEVYQDYINYRDELYEYEQLEEQERQQSYEMNVQKLDNKQRKIILVEPVPNQNLIDFKNKWIG